MQFVHPALQSEGGTSYRLRIELVLSLALGWTNASPRGATILLQWFAVSWFGDMGKLEAQLTVKRVEAV